MLENFLFSNTKIPILKKSLDLYAQRERAIAANIANIGTIGYKRLDVEFEKHMADASSMNGSEQLAGVQTDTQHIAINPPSSDDVKMHVARSKETEAGISGVNDVDIDYEMAQLAQNQIRFKYASRLIADSFRNIRRSITGGGGTA